MLTAYRPHFIERVFTDQAGRQFRLVFLVTFVDGQLKGRLVSAEPISSKARTSGCVPCLPVACPTVKANTQYIAPVVPTVSPYTELFFLTSQPTRAPSK